MRRAAPRRGPSRRTRGRPRRGRSLCDRRSKHRECDGRAPHQSRERALLPQYRRRRRRTHRRHGRRALPGDVSRLQRRDGMPRHPSPQREQLLDVRRIADDLTARSALRSERKCRFARGRLAWAHVVVRLRRGALSSGIYGRGASRVVPALRCGSAQEQYGARAVRRVLRRQKPHQPRNASEPMGAAALFLGHDRGRLRRHADDGSATRCAARARELEVGRAQTAALPRPRDHLRRGAPRWRVPPLCCRGRRMRFPDATL